MSPEGHAGAVESVRRSIEAGDTYQANLTFAMDAPLDGGAVDLFRRMVQSQGKSYGAFIDLGDSQIISISPELFLAGLGQRVKARPMKGTAPRGRSSSEDGRFVERLVDSEKERAGNMMIVDLLRNDLGRVSETGSVTTTDLCRPERYPTVWQLTSTVEGVLQGDVGLFELFAAAFPSGSVTGAPKQSTMEIISQLETVPKGVYCGAIGYIAPGGEEFEFSVAIRTGVVREGSIRYHVGGGITYDSIAGAEYEECLWKALAVTAENVVPSLLETMLYRPGVGIELLDRHLRRLSGSADFWEIPLDLEAVGDALSGVGGHRDQRVRLILMPGGDVEVEVHEVEVFADPVELSISQSRVDPTEPHWFHKTLDRRRYPEVDEGEVVMVNLRGEVTETNISNLMVRFDDEWLTPPLDSGCLPGVYRQKLLDEGEVVERIVTLDDLRQADEIAVTNAVRGRRKAVLVN
jgi:para-aminobenzoate synthetase/4-amino-4-deoxychorismate lyase